MLRDANIAIMNFLRGLTYGDKQLPLNVVYASPERAFSSMAQVLKKDVKLVPLPILSFYRDRDPIINRDIFTWNRGEKDEVLVNGGKAVSILPRPLAYILNYRIDIWSWYTDEIEDLITLIIGQFNLDLYLQQHSEVGTIYLRLELGDITDNSQIESGQDPRMLRKTISVSANTFLVRPPSTVPTVLDFRIEIDDLHSGDVYETIGDFLGAVSIPTYEFTTVLKNSSVADYENILFVSSLKQTASESTRHVLQQSTFNSEFHQ